MLELQNHWAMAIMEQWSSGYGAGLSRPYPLKYFEDWLPQTLLSLLLNTLSHLFYRASNILQKLSNCCTANSRFRSPYFKIVIGMTSWGFTRASLIRPSQMKKSWNFVVHSSVFINLINYREKMRNHQLNGNQISERLTKKSRNS